MFIAKERVLLDSKGKCVKADDPSGVQVLAGFKGAVISEKIMRNVRGADAFFEPDNLTKHRTDSTSKRVEPEPEPTHPKAARVTHNK